VLSPISEGKEWLVFQITETLAKHNPEEFVGFISGRACPDRLRRFDEVKEFVSAFYKLGKPIGTICHGPQVLISAKVVEGVTMTSVSAIKDDLENAGAIWLTNQWWWIRTSLVAEFPMIYRSIFQRS